MITFTNDDLAALKAALKSNAKSVVIGDRRVDFKSTEDILQTIRLIQSMLETAPESSPKVITTTFSKGKA